MMHGPINIRCNNSKVETALVNSVRYVTEYLPCVVVYCTGCVMLQTTIFCYEK